MEEYKKLSELPQASNPNKCEAYGIENGKSVRVPLNFISQAELNKEKTERTTAINNLQSAISTENTNRIDADTTIKNSMVKSCVSTDEAFNDVVKELYFDKFVDTSKISTIGLKRNGVAGEYIVWEMYIVDTNGKSSWASFGANAEKFDVNVAAIEAKEGHFLYDKGVSVYAVIDWNKVPNNNGVGETTENFSVRDKMLTSINNAKYFPKISECLANHKYTHSPIANSVIKELYFENLTKNGTLVSDYEFKRFFYIERIDRQMQNNNGEYFWSIVFYINNTDIGYRNHLHKTYYSSPEDDDVLKIELVSQVGDDLYSATVYIVLDWSKLKSGTSNTITASLLSGCLDVRNSPIIYNYIEINKLREELNLRPINE